MSEHVTRVVGIPGSLRRGSYNRGLLRAAQELAPEGMEISILGLEGIPPFSQDEEADPPTPVADMKQAMRDADAVLFATPEYNYSVPGLLKNAIDWASRPPGQSVLRHKPVAIMGATTGLAGTARAQLALRQSFVFTETFCVQKPEVLVAFAGQKFDAEGNLFDEETRRWVRSLLEALELWTRRVMEAVKVEA